MPHIYKIISNNQISKQIFLLNEVKTIIKHLNKKNIDAKLYRFAKDFKIPDQSYTNHISFFKNPSLSRVPKCRLI